MKKLAGILALLLLTGAVTMAQKQVLLKIKVAPNHHYQSEMKMNMDMEMKVSTADGKTSDPGGDAVLMNMGYSLTGDMKTKNAAPGKVPFSMGIKMAVGSMKMNGQDMAAPIPPVNETLYGSYDNGFKMSVDSIAGKGASDETAKAAMIKLVDEFQAGLKFPEKAVKIGDTFNQDIPMDMPVAGMTAKMRWTVTYKLLSITDKKAYFDLNYVISTDTANKASAITMTGTGSGKLIYDITENYPTSNNSIMDVTFSMTMPQGQDIKMAGKMKMTTLNQTIISAN